MTDEQKKEQSESLEQELSPEEMKEVTGGVTVGGEVLEVKGTRDITRSKLTDSSTDKLGGDDLGW